MTPGELEELLLSDTENDVDPALLAQLDSDHGSLTAAVGTIQELRRSLAPLLANLSPQALRQLSVVHVVCRDCDERTVAYVLRPGSRRVLVAREQKREPFVPVAVLDPHPLPGLAHFVCRRVELAVSPAAIAAHAGARRVRVGHDGTVC